MRTPIDTRPCRSLEQAKFERCVGLWGNATIAAEYRPADEAPALQADGHALTASAQTNSRGDQSCHWREDGVCVRPWIL